MTLIPSLLHCHWIIQTIGCFDNSTTSNIWLSNWSILNYEGLISLENNDSFKKTSLSTDTNDLSLKITLSDDLYNISNDEHTIIINSLRDQINDLVSIIKINNSDTNTYPSVEKLNLRLGLLYLIFTF